MKQKKRSKGTRFSLWLPTELLERYRRMAKNAGVSASSLIVAAASRAYRRKKGSSDARQ
jgi:hypothetical protein